MPSNDATILDEDPDDGSAARLVAAADQLFVSHGLPASGELTIGRSRENDVMLDHESVSRRHARLHLGPPLRLEDLGSANGTTVNGARLEPSKSVTIRTGDLALLGRVSVWVVAPRKAQASPVPTVDGAAPVIEADAMRGLMRMIDRVAPGPINVLLLGETGVGKEVIARCIHARSSRAQKPFVGLNCAAVSEALLESEFFGHEKGAFTGAAEAKAGLLESAQGGTVFLDEVGELALPIQAKLLRALEERQVQRVGSLKPRPIDVRFVSATNRDLDAEIKAGRFRSDLYFRVNGITLAIPPLRERKAEIGPLVRRFIDTFCERLSRPAPPLADGVIDVLVRHEWPGNIRELRNVVERAVLLCGDSPLGAEHLLLGPAGGLPAPELAPPTEDGGERARILAVLDEHGGNQTRAAKALGISRNTLLARLDRYGIIRPRKRRTPGSGPQAPS